MGAPPDKVQIASGSALAAPEITERVGAATIVEADAGAGRTESARVLRFVRHTLAWRTVSTLRIPIPQ